MERDAALALKPRIDLNTIKSAKHSLRGPDASQKVVEGRNSIQVLRVQPITRNRYI